MKRLLALVLIIALIFGAWWMFFRDKEHNSGLKQQPLKVGKHSSEFNQSVTDAITQYLSLKDAFVNADTAKISV